MDKNGVVYAVSESRAKRFIRKHAPAIKKAGFYTTVGATVLTGLHFQYGDVFTGVEMLWNQSVDFFHDDKGELINAFRTKG